jgi:hypothetical protein
VLTQFYSQSSLMTLISRQFLIKQSTAMKSRVNSDVQSPFRSSSLTNALDGHWTRYYSKEQWDRMVPLLLHDIGHCTTNYLSSSPRGHQPFVLFGSSDQLSAREREMREVRSRPLGSVCCSVLGCDRWNLWRTVKLGTNNRNEQD